MKREYCKIQKEEKGFYEKIVNVIIKSRNGDGSIVDIHKDIEIWSPAWKVLLGTEENPHKIVDDIQQHCITNNEIQFENYYDYDHWNSNKKEIIRKISNYTHSIGCNYDSTNHIGYIEITKRYKYMTDDTGKELVFLSELDAFNYLSKNGGWYLDHTIPLIHEGYSSGEKYIMARNIDE